MLENRKKEDITKSALLDEVNYLLTQDLPVKEYALIQQFRLKLLDNRNYFPKLALDFEKKLTPLAINQKLSKPLAEFYLSLTKLNKTHQTGTGLSYILSSLFNPR